MAGPSLAPESRAPRRVRFQDHFYHLELASAERPVRFTTKRC